MNNLTDQELLDQLNALVNLKKPSNYFWFSQWFKTSLLVFAVIALILTFVGFIIKFDSNFHETNKNSYLIFGIVFIVCFVISITFYIAIKKALQKWNERQNKMLMKNVIKILPIYQKLLKTEQLEIIDINGDFASIPQSILPPTYYETDHVISGKYKSIPFQLGTFSIRSRLDLNHFDAKIRTVKDQQDNFYRMVVLVIDAKTPFCENENVVLWKRENIVSYMIEFNNIYDYDTENEWISQIYFQKEVLKCITETRFVPNIEINDKHMYFSMNIFTINGFDDYTYQFFNTETIFTELKTDEALLKTIKQDCLEIDLIAKWIKNYFIR